MVIVMHADVTEAQIARLCARITELGFTPHVSRGLRRTVIGVVGAAERRPELESLESWTGVERVVAVDRPYKLVAREAHPEGSVVRIRGLPVGAREVVVMAGPCAVESRDQRRGRVRSCSSAVWRRAWKSCCSPRSASPPEATRTSSCVSAGFARSRPRRATRSTSVRCRPPGAYAPAGRRGS